MAFKSVRAGITCVILLAFTIIWFLVRRKTTPARPATNHIIAINKLLYKLRKECINGQTDVAQNTFEDVKQEWEYLDILPRNQLLWPSDSLRTLDSLVKLMLNDGKSKTLVPIVLNEINAVNNRLDKSTK